MSIKQLKRYFLSDKDREVYEKNVVNEMPELGERVFYLDDEELENLLKQIIKNELNSCLLTQIIQRTIKLEPDSLGIDNMHP